ncbi:hypothetical protein WH52_12250 [Tenacibaculum holothuriorum]|uniref:Uncharacterized protein n=1 Tax=Tenacibaculum holothuriorum TaxID=1635173 RepID=A0A1Y2PC28_9FLAO|nr:hypothetical protein [Tenacibaculum holothuriorum]OSY87228.1 hypothetical protein WH52_12250 [Tenacibaculum holothuriorum]
MKKIIVCFLLIVNTICFGQSSYSGTLGEYPITLVTYHYSDGVSLAYYSYNKYDTPITINGNLKGRELTLYEKKSKNQVIATLTFSNFEIDDTVIRGKWVNTKTKKELNIYLKKDFDINYGDDLEWDTKELLQSKSTKKHYFKTIISKKKRQFYGRVIGVKVFEKRTDRLIQKINLDCQLFGIDNVSVDDYNFDGIQDFSVFEASYTGPNTSSIYILKEPKSENYFVSDFSGTSLEFNSKEKLIYEHNQCCGGSRHTNATYKVIDNKMVLIERKCIEYDKEKEDYVNVKCE